MFQRSFCNHLPFGAEECKGVFSHPSILKFPLQKMATHLNNIAKSCFIQQNEVKTCSCTIIEVHCKYPLTSFLNEFAWGDWWDYSQNGTCWVLQQSSTVSVTTYIPINCPILSASSSIKLVHNRKTVVVWPSSTRRTPSLHIICTWKGINIL